MNNIVLKKFKLTPKSHDTCIICNKRSVHFKNKVCKDCVLFYENVTKNIVDVGPISCTKDLRCFHNSRKNFCPWHKYLKCEMYLSKKKKSKSIRHDSPSCGSSVEKVTNISRRDVDTSNTSNHNVSSSEDFSSTPDSSIANQESQKLPIISSTLPVTLKIKCGVCENRRLSALNNPHLCKKCYQFCLTVQCNKLPLRCRRDSSCLKFTTTQFCPDHMYQKCLKFIDINNDSSFKSNMNSSLESNSSSIGSPVKEELMINEINAEEINELETKLVNVTNTKKISPSRRNSRGVMCGVCHKRRLGRDNKLCTQCYKYYHMVDSQQIAVNCTQDIRCSGKKLNEFCPLHRFKACQQLIQNEITAKEMNIEINNSSNMQMNQCFVHTCKKTNESVVRTSKEASDSIVNYSNMEYESIVNTNKEASESLVINNKDKTDSIVINNKETSEPIVINNKETTEPIVNNNKETIEPIVINNKETTEPIVINNKETSEPIVINNKQTTEPIVINNKETTEPIVNNNKKTTEPTVNNNKETTEPIFNNNKETTELIVNNNKETTEPIFIKNKETTESIVNNNNKETTKSTVKNNRETTEYVDNTTKNVTQFIVNTSKATAHFVLNMNSLDKKIELNLFDEKENRDQNSNDLQNENSFLKILPKICPENTIIEVPNDENTSNSQSNSTNHSDIQNNNKILKFTSKNEMCLANIMTNEIPDHKNTPDDPKNNINYSEKLQNDVPLNATTEVENNSSGEEMKQPSEDKMSFFCISVNADSEVPQNSTHILERVSKSNVSSKIQESPHVFEDTTEKLDDWQMKKIGANSNRKYVQQNEKSIKSHHKRNTINNNISKLDCQNRGSSKHLCKSDESSLPFSEKSGSHKSKSKDVNSKEAPKINKSHKNNEPKQSSNSETNSKNTLQTSHLHEKAKKSSTERNATNSEKKTNKSQIKQSENLDHNIDKTQKRNSTKKDETNTLVHKTKEYNQSEDDKMKKRIEHKVSKNLENSLANSNKKKTAINIETNYCSRKAKKKIFIEVEKTINEECSAIKGDKQKIEKRKQDSSSSYNKGILLHKKMKLQENVKDIINKYKTSSSQNEVGKHVKVNISKVESHDTIKKKEETMVNQSQTKREISMKEITSLETKAQQNSFESSLQSKNDGPSVTIDNQTIDNGLDNGTKIISSELNQRTTDSKIGNDAKESEQPKKSGGILDFVVHDELDFEEEFPDIQLSNVNVDNSKDTESLVNESATVTERNDSQNRSNNPNNINETKESEDDGSKNIDVDCPRHEGSSNTLQVNPEEKLPQKQLTQKQCVPKTISPQSKGVSKVISPYTKDVLISPRTTSPQLENVSTQSNDGRQTKKPCDFLSNNYPILKKKLTARLLEDRRPLLKFLAQVSLERRMHILRGLLSLKSSDPILMAIACYALYWNSDYRLAEFFELLHSLLVTRYETFLNIVMRVVIVLAHDEVFSDIILQYAKDCGKTHLIPPEKRKNILRKMLQDLTSKAKFADVTGDLEALCDLQYVVPSIGHVFLEILPAVINASGLLFHCFKLMVADNLEIPDTLMLETGRELAKLRKNCDLDYFVNTLREIYSGRIHELLDKLKNNNNPVLPYFLHTHPDDVACKYLNVVRPDEHQQNVNGTLYPIESSREQLLEHEQYLCAKQNNADKSDNRHMGYSNVSQSESICRPQNFSSSSIESASVSVFRSSTVSKPHLKNGIFDYPSRPTASRDDISLNMLQNISDGNLFERNNSPSNMNESSYQSPCGRFSPEPLNSDETLASPDTEADGDVYSFGIGSSDSLELSSSVSPKNSALQVSDRSSNLFGASKLMTPSSHIFGQSISNSLKRSNPHNPVEQTCEILSESNSVNSNASFFSVTKNSQASQKSFLAPSNAMLSGQTISETSVSQVIVPLIPKFILKPPLSSNSNSQLLKQPTLFSSSYSNPQRLGESSSLSSNSNAQLFEQQTSFSSSNCKTQLFGQLTPLISKSNPQLFKQPSSLSSSNSNQCASLQPKKNTFESFSLFRSTNETISQPEANLSGTLASTSGIFGCGKNFPQSAISFGALRSTPGLFAIEKTFPNSWNPSIGVKEDNDITVVEELPKTSKIIETINLLSDESNDSVDADTSAAPSAHIAKTVLFMDPDDSSDPNLPSTRSNHLNNSTNIDTDMPVDVIMEDTLTTSEDVRPLFPDVDRGVEECKENTPKPKKRKTGRISFKDQIEDVREISQDLREILLSRQLERDSASDIALPVKSYNELCNDANDFISRLRSNYNSMNDTEKLQFINAFYSSQLPQSHFEFILRQCERSELLMRNLSSVVLNRLAGPENPIAWNDAKDHAIMLVTRNMHDFIHTPMIRQNWTPLRTGLFLYRLQRGYTEKVFPLLERYNLLDRDRTAWRLTWEEEDMAEYCVCLSLLLRSFNDSSVFKCISLCQTLMFWYKETPGNFSSSGLDFPSILHKATLQLLDEYFFLSTVSNDKDQKYHEVGSALLPLIESVVTESRLSAALTRGCVCYFVHMKLQDLAITTMRNVPLSPPLYSVYEDGDVIHIKDIYLKEEMTALFTHALKNISPELVDLLKNNRKVIKVHLEKFSLTTAGHLAQRDLEQNLPALFSLMGRSPSLQERVLDSLNDLQHIIDSEFSPGVDTLLLHPALTVAVVQSFQNTRMLRAEQ